MTTSSHSEIFFFHTCQPHCHPKRYPLQAKVSTAGNLEKGQTQRGCPGERQKWGVCELLQKWKVPNVTRGRYKKGVLFPQWRDCDVITTRGPNMRNEEGLIKFEGKIFIFHQCPNYGFCLVAAFLPVRKRSIFNQSFFARDLYDRCVLCERYRRPQKKLAILATVSFHMIATTAFFFWQW